MALSAAHAACVRQLSLRLHTLIRTRSCRHSGLMTSSSVPAHMRGLVLRQASSGAATPVTPTAATRTIWQPRISRAWLCGPTSGSVVQSHARARDGPAAARVCDTGLPEPLGVLVARVSPGDDVTVVGWVRHVRRQKRVTFATVSDGSAGGTLQVVFNDPAHCPRELTTGAAVRLTGTVVASPRADHQAIELHVMSESGVEVVGACSGETYPLGGKSHSLEYLREKLHLRPRTARIGAVLRVRSALARALHAFFDSNHFFQVHTPLITTNDCEGGGETFNVTAPGYEAAHKAAPDGTSAMFFGGTAHLTVSGQLHAEAIATALSRVYTFGPTFRAENSTGTRHLAEFYMLEAEVAFAGLDAAVTLAEGCVRHCAQELVGNARTAEDLALLWDQHHSGADVAASWTTTMSEPFARMSYTDAVRALSASGVDFRREVAWGDDLQHEHEQWLARELHGRPVVVYDYPKSLKPFYMRQNDDGATVAAFDLLVPGVGELVGGSAREERLDHLEAAIPRDALAGLDWYLDLRRFGTVPHAGFGLGFERLVQYFTGMANIRDVIPFPRHVGTCRL